MLLWTFHRKCRSIRFYIKFIDEGRLSGKKMSIHEALLIFCGRQRSIACFRQTIGAKSIIKVDEILGNQFYYFQLWGSKNEICVYRRQQHIQNRYLNQKDSVGSVLSLLHTFSIFNHYIKRFRIILLFAVNLISDSVNIINQLLER